MTAKGMVMIQNKVVNTFKRLEYVAYLLYIIFFHSRCGFSESIVLQCVQDHNKKVNKLSEQNYTYLHSDYLFSFLYYSTIPIKKHP